MQAGRPSREGRERCDGRPSDDPFLRALQGRLRGVRAPESLRLRIRVMLAMERARTLVGEPEDDPLR
jgi:hypothetical protein